MRFLPLSGWRNWRENNPRAETERFVSVGHPCSPHPFSVFPIFRKGLAGAGRAFSPLGHAPLRPAPPVHS